MTEVRVQIKKTFDQIRAAAFATDRTVYFGAYTCWWTIEPDDLSTDPDKGIPCGPRGEPLFKGNASQFISNAMSNSSHYGRHGLQAFAAAYHGNLLCDDRPWSFRTWDEYNEAIDRAIAVGKLTKLRKG